MQPVFDHVNEDAAMMDHEELEVSLSVPHENILSIYRPEQEIDARRHLDRFFADKRLPNGRPVPSSMTHTSENIELLVREDFSVEQVDMIYREMGTLDAEPDQTGVVSDDVRFVLKSLQECAALKIPKPMAPGVILIYLRICQAHQGLRLAN